MSFCEITLIGHLGAPAELRYTKNQVPVLTISVGVSEKLRPNDPKDKKPKTYWHKCRRFGKYAEILAPQLKKGDKVFLKGNLVYDVWEDQKNFKHKDAVIEIELLEKMIFENITIDMGD